MPAIQCAKLRYSVRVIARRFYLTPRARLRPPEADGNIRARRPRMRGTVRPDSARQANTMHRRRRVGTLPAVAAMCGAALGLAAPASAVPAISGSDADVWNAGSPGVRYVLTTDEGNRKICLLYTSPSPRDLSTSRMPSSA